MMRLIAALGVSLCLVFAVDARASNPITFRWETRARLNSDITSWNASDLTQPGYPHFVVNGTGRPTRKAKNQYKQIWFLYGGTTPMKAYFNRFEASAEYGILRLGSNTVHFTYGPILPIDHLTNDSISMHGSEIGNVGMFRLASSDNNVEHWYGPDDGSPGPDGTVSGDAIDPSSLNHTFNLSLEQVAPQLAADIKNFEAVLQRDLDKLVANAAEITNLASQLQNLENLKKELAELLKQDLGDELAFALDRLLARYTEIPASTREALVKIVNDLHSAIAQMQAELSRTTTDFRNQTDEIVDLVERPTVADGWNPNDLSNYVTVIDPHQIPGVVVPDTQSGPFDSAHDPYKAYADQIITMLGQYVQDESVVARKDFLGIVRGWRKNQTALEDALRARGYPLQETSAFNAARTRVTDHLDRYLKNDWFVDNPVPQTTRNAIDGVIARQFVDLAPRLKEAMNEWRGRSLVGNQVLAVETVGGIATGIDELDPADFDTRAHVRSALEGITSGILAGVRLGVGFTPFVGDAMDICEAITGYEFCTSTARKMSVSERICSALGAVIANGYFWRGVSRGVDAEYGVIVPIFGKVSDRLSDLPVAERKELLARFGHVIASLDNMTGTEIKRLGAKFGDNAILQLAPKVKTEGLRELDKLNFFLAKMNDKVQLAWQTRGAAVKALPPMRGKTYAELRDTLQRAGFKKDNASNAVQEIWLYKGGPRDGSVVRLAMTGNGTPPVPHFKKEISFNDGFEQNDIACKLSDEGVPVPQGPNQAGELMKQWFYAIAGHAPDPAPGGAFRIMLDIWGAATHIPFT